MLMDVTLRFCRKAATASSGRWPDSKCVHQTAACSCCVSCQGRGGNCCWVAYQVPNIVAQQQQSSSGSAATSRAAFARQVHVQCLRALSPVFVHCMYVDTCTGCGGGIFACLRPSSMHCRPKDWARIAFGSAAPVQYCPSAEQHLNRCALAWDCGQRVVPKCQSLKCYRFKSQVLPLACAAVHAAQPPLVIDMHALTVTSTLNLDMCSERCRDMMSANQPAL
jgi:hypothetical protein